MIYNMIQETKSKKKKLYLLLLDLSTLKHNFKKCSNLTFLHLVSHHWELKKKKKSTLSLISEDAFYYLSILLLFFQLAAWTVLANKFDTCCDISFSFRLLSERVMT